MRKTYWTILLGLLFALVPNIFTPVNAQKLNLGSSHALTNNENSAVSKDPLLAQEETPDDSDRVGTEFTVGPRFRLDYNSSGGGFDDFSGIEGFVPLSQTYDSALTYLSGRLNLDNDANLGSNLLLGHRFWVPKDKRIYGGYVAWDTRDTGSEVFNQLGLGIESLGDRWDWRVNSYLPLGNSRRASSRSGSQITGANFQNNNLLLGLADVQAVQSALTGIEAEAGLKITEFGNSGSLRGFGGLYYLTGDDVNGTVGARFRVQAQPIASVSLGTGIQFDDIFGTNFLFRVGVGFPALAVRSRDRPSTPDRLVQRLAEPVARNHAILVERQQFVDNSQAEAIAINPLTGEAYSFQHVDPLTGAAGGTGTFESPVNTIAAAVPLSASGHIVYVQAGDIGGGFTVPDGVQVRSVGPVQTVDTQLGKVQLPGSGSGNFPTLSNGDGVVLGNNTVLSGLEINNAFGDAILGSSLENVTIQDNRVNGAFGAGIRLEDVGENVLIERNRLDNSVFDTGIFVTASGNISQQLTIKNNSINGNAEQGILVRTTDSAQVVADIQDNVVAGNNVGSPSLTGIEVETNNTAPGSLCLRFEGNSSDTNATFTLADNSRFDVVDLANVDTNNAGTVSLVDLSGTTSFTEVSSCAQ